MIFDLKPYMKINLSNYIEHNFIYTDRLDEVYLFSDAHLLHKNILQYDKDRWDKFSSISEHNEYIINELNKLPSDCKLIFLWDLALGNNDKVVELVSKINIEHKYWVLGNHDSKSLINKCAHLRKTISDDILVNNYIYLNHYPPVDYLWNIKYKVEKWNLYIHGHTHKWDWLRKNNVVDISYNGNKLIYNLQELL